MSTMIVLERSILAGECLVKFLTNPSSILIENETEEPCAGNEHYSDGKSYHWKHRILPVRQPLRSIVLGLAAYPEGLNVFNRTIKESKLFIDAEQLLKIFSGVRFTQS